MSNVDPSSVLVANGVAMLLASFGVVLGALLLLYFVLWRGRVEASPIDATTRVDEDAGAVFDMGTRFSLYNSSLNSLAEAGAFSRETSSEAQRTRAKVFRRECDRWGSSANKACGGAGSSGARDLTVDVPYFNPDITLLGS